MSGHTPGPWVWRDTDFENDDMPSLRDSVGTEICNFGNCREFYPSPGESPNKYDRLLIAAAPELLEALEGLLEEFSKPIPVINFADARAAIARAKGEK